jgi:glyceraldehyde 3-phosphate dehydrogenase
MREVGFIAESVRVPVNTGSIVILAVSLQDEDPEKPIDRDRINEIYRKAADGYLSPYISYSESQNVSSDMIGTVSAAVIEGRETRTRTGWVRVSLGKACNLITEGAPSAKPEASILEIPVTQIVVYGWYDNVLGSFSNIMGETTLEVAKKLMK